jgi:hypothetical protein
LFNRFIILKKENKKNKINEHFKNQKMKIISKCIIVATLVLLEQLARNALAASEPEAATPLRKTTFPLSKDAHENDLSSVPIKNTETLAQRRAYLNLKSNLQHSVGKRGVNEEDVAYFVVQRDNQRRKQQKNHHHKKGQVLCRLFNLGKFYSKPPNVDCF